MLIKNLGPLSLFFCLTECNYCIYCQQHVKLFQHNETYVKYLAWYSLTLEPFC